MNIFILIFFILPAWLVFNKLTVSAYLLMRLSSIAIIFISFLIMITFLFSFNLYLIPNLPFPFNFSILSFFFFNDLFLTILPFYCSILNYFLPFAINGGTIVLKNMFDLIYFLNSIVFYSFTYNWSSNILLFVSAWPCLL